MASYVVLRWVLIPLVIVLLPLLWSVLSNLVRAILSLFSAHDAVRRSAREYFASQIIPFAIMAAGLLLLLADEAVDPTITIAPEVQYGIVASLVAGALVFSWLSARNRKRKTDQEIDQVLAQMRAKSADKR